jgi:DNA-binding protein YbaB
LGGGVGAAKARDPELVHIEQRFIDTLGTKVVITGDLSRGRIKIDYDSMDDVDRLMDLIIP